MKKYWPVLSLAIISIIGLSFYYINIAKATNVNIDFQFETLEGDAKYIDNILLQTGFSEDRKYESYYIKKDSVEDLDNIFVNYEDNYEMLKLFKEHKNFFRAKQFTGRNFFNDDESLVYVYTNDKYNYQNPNKALYQIDILNKQTKEIEEYEIITSVEDIYSLQTVQFVSFEEQQLKVISIRTYAYNQEAVILTTFDLQKGTAQENVLLAAVKDKHITFYNYQDTYNSKQYVAFGHYKNKYDQEYTTVLEYDLYMVDIVTNEIENVTTKNTDDFYDYETNVFNEYLTAYKEKDSIVHVLRYNMKTKQWLEDYEIEMALDMPEDLFKHYQLLDDKIYMNYEVENGTAIEIVDFNSGKKLYTGLLTAKDISHPHKLYVERVFHIK